MMMSVLFLLFSLGEIRFTSEKLFIYFLCLSFVLYGFVIISRRQQFVKNCIIFMTYEVKDKYLI